METGHQYKLSLYEQCQMFRVLSAMTRASIGLIDSLDLMEKSEDKARLAQVYARISICLAQGHALSSALQKSSPSFSLKTVSILKLGEETGGLTECLDSLAQDFEVELTTVREIKAALVYPLSVAVIAILAFGGLLVYLLPKMLELLKALDTETPFYLRTVLSVYEGLTHPLALFLLSQLALGLFLYWRRLKSNPDFEVKRDRILTHLPLVGQLSLQLNAFHFARGLRTLLRVGCPVVTALRLLIPTLSNTYYALILGKVLDDVRHEGIEVSASMKERNLFGSPFHQMLSSGEESGQSTEILALLADFYLERCRETLQLMQALLEPTVLLVLGMGVGCLVLGFFMPLMDVIGQI